MYAIKFTLTFDLMNSISLQIIYWSCSISLLSLRSVGISILQLSIRQALLGDRKTCP